MGTCLGVTAFARVQSDSDSDNIDTNNNISPKENGESFKTTGLEERRRRISWIEFTEANPSATGLS